MFNRSPKRVVATGLATEQTYFGFDERFIAGRKTASSLSAASLCIVSVTCEYRSRIGTGADKGLSTLPDTQHQQFLRLLSLESAKLIDCEGGKGDGGGSIRLGP